MKTSYSAATMFALMAAMMIPTAFAEESTTLNLISLGSSVIDLNSPEMDRFVNVYAQFENFNIDDGVFTSQIVHSSTGTVVAEYDIFVGSTATGLVDFNSLVAHVVTSGALDDGDVLLGDHQMIISTVDGSVSGSIEFSIVDSRT